MKKSKLLKINSQQEITIGQLRLKIRQLEKAQGKPLVDVDRVLAENEKLREQERQIARALRKLAAGLEQV